MTTNFMRFKFTFSIIIAFFCGHSLLANLHFKNLTSNNGLSSSRITSITQDLQGFIWIGTEDGLTKYDGSYFHIYKNDPDDKSSLYSNHIYSLFIDREGELWIGTSKGVNIYNRKEDSFTRMNHLPRENIYAIAQDAQGHIYIGAHNFFFLNSLNDQLTEFYPDARTNKSISHGIVNTIYIDSASNIWVGTKNGLNLFSRNLGAFKSFMDNIDDLNSLRGNDIRSITRDEYGYLWVGTNEGLNKGIISGNKIIFESFIHDASNPYSISEGAILSLHCDNYANLWIGTQNGGLNRLQLNSSIAQRPVFMHYQHQPFIPNTISNNTIQTIYEDFQENIWIGTYAGGINIYKRNAKPIELQTRTPDKQRSVINNHVNTFLEDDLFIWIGTEGGLSRYNKKTHKYTHFTHDKMDPNSIGSNAVWALTKDYKGQLLIGTWGGGLSIFDKEGEQFTNYMPESTKKETINSVNVFAILPEENGDLWIGTMGGGLNYFNKSDQTYTHYTISNSSIKTNFVEEIIKLSDDVLLLANVDGVTKFNTLKREFSSVPLTKSTVELTPDLNVYAIYKDSRKNIWVGTEGGLYALDRNLDPLKHYTVNEGLPHNAIKSIKEDSHGNFWMGTNSGISKFKKAIELPEQAEFTNFTIEDGLQGNEFNRRAALITKDGTMYFGGINGLNRFHPDSIRLNSFIPNAEIVDFFISGNKVVIGTDTSPLQEHVSNTKKIVLRADQNNFGFRFTAFNYISPENNLFAYKLDGFDEDWNYLSNHRETHYTNINPGKYTFKVKAANNDGLWNHNYRKIEVIVMPPWWQTYWAYIGYMIMFFILITAYKRYSFIEIKHKNQLLIEHITHKKQEEINQAKLNFFTNLSHEIRTPLTLIKEPVEDLINNPTTDHKVKATLLPTQKNIQRLLNLINQILDFRKIDTGGEVLNITKSNINNLIADIISAFNCESNQKKIKFHFSTEKPKHYAWFDYEKMTTIIYNLISNAVKHSPPDGQIEIKVKEIYKPINFSKRDKTIKILSLFRKEKAPILEIRVTDKGCGIAQKQIPLIFKRYYRIFGSTIKTEGTGIGLDITKQYIELHNGKIWVESRENEGSSFIFQIPVNNNMPSAQNNELQITDDTDVEMKTTPLLNLSDLTATAQHKSIKLLIVEDNADLLKYLAEKLKSEYQITTAINGKQGIELAKKINPDIIITDIMMPEMDGLEMTKLLKEDISTSHIPIIVLTAKANEESQISGIKNGAETYLTKPFSTEVLRTYINRLLQTRAALIEKYRKEIYLKPTDIAISNTDEVFVEKLLKITNEHLLNTEFNVQDLSSELNMSYRALARKIKALTNQTANEFIRSIRLKRAADLLKTSGMTINEISTLTGFNDPAYFSRCFRDEFDVTPTDFQKIKTESSN